MMTGCDLWMGGRTNDGHGYVYISSKYVLAHRMTWEMFNGPIPPGWDVHHTCHNGFCVNPEHLQTMPHAEHSRLHIGSLFPLRKEACKNGHPFTTLNRTSRDSCAYCEYASVRRRNGYTVKPFEDWLARRKARAAA